MTRKSAPTPRRRPKPEAPPAGSDEAIIAQQSKPLSSIHLVDRVMPSRMRPFRPHGELIESLGPHYVVAPMSKWSDTTMYEEALHRASIVYRSRTNVFAPKFSADTILIQEYHRQDRIAFIFAHFGRQMGMHAPGWMYVPVVIKLTGPLKTHLVLTGRWPSKVEPLH